MLQIIGARVQSLRPEIVLALIAINDAYREIGCDCVLRYGIDGEHSVGSEHYVGLAVDIRTHNVPPEQRENLIKRIRVALGPDYDVLWEARGTPNEHLHVEFDPKRPY